MSGKRVQVSESVGLILEIASRSPCDLRGGGGGGEGGRREGGIEGGGVKEEERGGDGRQRKRTK